MLKQWKNENLGVIYFFVPNAKNNEILTTDGVLIPYADFKKMTSESYASKKNTNGGYDYELSRKSERLVKKVVNTTVSKQEEKIEQKQNPITTTTDFTKESKNMISVEKPIKTIQKPTVVKTVSTPTFTQNISNIEKKINSILEKNNKSEKTEVIKPTVEIKSNEVKETVKKEEKQEIKNTEKYSFNLFDWAYPKIMILITIICSTLSVYFTATYLRRLQNIILSYAISLSMLLYGLIGFQIARRKQKEKKRKQAFVYYATSIMVILFSMLSSIDVNYSKYKIHHADEEITYNTNDGVRISYNILKQELEDNKEIISNAQKDIEFQQTQWVLAWDNELGKNVLLEGRISATAQEKIKEDNQRIEELTLRNKEINAKLIEYAQSGITMNKEEGNLEKSKSLTDLLGMLLGLSGDLIQLIFLLVPSFFIDVINLMAISIYCDSFEKE